MILHAHSGTKAGDELEVLEIQIGNYEKQHYPIVFPIPFEAIKFCIKQLLYNQSDLVKVLGFKSRASEVLIKKRKLTLDMIRQLHQTPGVPTDVLI